MIAYISKFLTYDMSKPEYQMAWTLLGPHLMTPVKTAWDDLYNAQAV